MPQLVDFMYIKNLRLLLVYVDDLFTFVRTIKLLNNVSFLPGRREYCTRNSCVGNLENRDGGRNVKIKVINPKTHPVIKF